MRNYVIINGVNSLTIKGLAINILPPISKPPMRTLREEIDGRDGDIVTELGYGAYDRTLEVGLYGNYDINEVIAFFNSKGTIVFSDENDKYYNFEIVDRIDFAKLVKFRTASINIHCQPFKYPLEEEPLEAEYEYVEGEGTELTLDDTADAPLDVLSLKGQTSQTGTPTPSSPIPVNVVSGDNEINICGKNLFDIGNSISGYFATTNNGLTINTSVDISTYVSATFDNNTITITNYNNSGYRWLSKLVKLNKNTTYTISSGELSQGVLVCGCNSLENGTTSTQLVRIDNQNLRPPKTFNSGNYEYYYIAIYPQQTGNVYPNIMVEVGSSSTTYEPYIGNTYPIYLGVENLFNLETADHVSISGTGVVGSNEDYRTTKYLPTQPNTNYYFSTTQISGQTSKQIYLCYYDSSQTFISRTSYNLLESKFTTPANCYYIRAGVYSKGQENIKLTEGDHLQYISSNPIELCKIGTYQDYIYKDNGSWYLHKEIGKVVLDSTYRQSGGTTGTNAYYIGTTILGLNDNTQALSWSNMFQPCSFNNRANGLDITYLQNGYLQIRTANNTSLDWSDNTKRDNWLNANKPICYYVLATPTTTLITDTLLLSQLDAIDEAVAYDGQTNISQENNDLGIWLVVKVLKKNSDRLIIDNNGNIYSKPILDLEGNGIVDIYLNGSQAFQVDLTDINEIIINTQEMEAYNPTTNALANRKVVGDYSKFKLDVGENELRFSGALTKATITYYQRWL